MEQSSELQCPEAMDIGTKHLGAGFETGFEAGFEGLKASKLEQNNMTKNGAFLVRKMNKKSRRTKKWISPIQF